jgi:hypothetical protein
MSKFHRARSGGERPGAPRPNGPPRAGVEVGRLRRFSQLNRARWAVYRAARFLLTCEGSSLSADTRSTRAEAEIATALAAALGQLLGDMMIGYALQRPDAETGLHEAREALVGNVAKFSFTATTGEGEMVDTSEEIRRRIIERIDAAEAFARRKIGLPARGNDGNSDA